MAVTKPETEIPYCTICLVVSTLVCHTLVLAGNLATSGAMYDLGKSTGGWSDIAGGLAYSLTHELDVIMTDVTATLTKAIAEVGEVQEVIDLAMGVSGKVADESSEEYESLLQQNEGKPFMTASIDEEEMMSLAQWSPPQAFEDISSPLALTEASFEVTYDGAVARFDPKGVKNVTASVVRKVGSILKNMSATLNLTFHLPSPDLFKSALKVVLRGLVQRLMGLVSMKLKSFLHLIKPALIQIGKWLVTFGDKLQSTIEGFSTSLDMVQKIFDQLMSSLSPSTHAGEAQMLYDTYTLFDVRNLGYIAEEDLKDAATMYGITSLQGDKSTQLFQKYDTDYDGKLWEKDYLLLVNDPSVPNAMSTSLRIFAKTLSVIAGNVAAARMRDEVAAAVVEYLTLTASQNMTKIGWVSQRLTNRSVPAQFTGCIMKQLAQNKDNPNKLIKADVGLIVISTMVSLNAPYVAEVLRLMATPEWWDSEGFDPADQPRWVEDVTNWIVQSPGGAEAINKVPSLIQKTERVVGHATPIMLEDMPRVARELTEERRRKYTRKQIRARREALMQTEHSESTQMLRYHILGGVMASAPRDVTQRMAVNKGQKAVPATLEFARFLASNATATAQRFQRQSFDYAHTSSNAVDSFANGIKAMIKKTQNFLHMMEEYSTETGIERLENMTDNFSVVAADDVTDVLMHAIDSKFDAMLKRASRATMTTLAQVSSEQFVEKAEFKMSGIWSQISLVLVSLQLALPAVVDDLKFARKEVSAVSQTLTNTFGAFKAKGPPIFYQVAALYSTLWVAYFTLFALLTVSVLFYGLWASGWFGGPQAAEADESYEPPQTFMDRCRACYASCNACVRGCQESSLCFWSVILVMEVLVLVLFLVSMVLCILAGVKAFLSAGCAQIYILGDDSICTGVLGTIKRWLLSFLANDRFLLEHACQEHTLLTCQLIGAKLKTSAVYTTVGSLLAAVLSFQMIVESAILHERARWRRIFDEESKRV